MFFKAYGGLPITYAPDIGEVLYARRTPADRWTLAVVLSARRNRAGHVRLKVQWLEDNPDAGSVRSDYPRVPIKAHTTGVLVLDPGKHALVRQVDRDRIDWRGSPPVRRPTPSDGAE
jgi:hypothetical protein